MLNRVQLIGNLGNDPEIRVTRDGREFITFSIATNSSWKDSKGEWNTQTDWHQVTVFKEPLVGWVRDTLKKGTPVFIEGRLTYSKWEDNYDQSRVSSTIVVSTREGIHEFTRSGKSKNREGIQMVETELQSSSSHLLQENNDISV